MSKSRFLFLAVYFLPVCMLLSCPSMQSQMMGQFPAYRNSLMIRTSADGNLFGGETKFIDSSGVPSLLKDAKGRILAAFQWFPAPLNSQNWDKVAVKISEDNGKTWSVPQVIVVSGLPSGFQRPFDPTLALVEDGRIRIFFSSGISASMVPDSNIVTYSAISTDGVNYTFEPGIRFSASGKVVIDPAALRIGKKWYFTSPKGAPQEGAYHGTSDDGLAFTRRGDIASDSAHQWTGNLVEYGSGMRFYGGGRQGVWWSYSVDGTSWTKPASITPISSGGTMMSSSVRGGDPAVVKITDTNYLLLYVSAPTTTTTMTAVAESNLLAPELTISPNPTWDIARVQFTLTKHERVSLKLYNVLGVEVASLLDTEVGAGEHSIPLNIQNATFSTLFVRLQTATFSQTKSVQVSR